MSLLRRRRREDPSEGAICYCDSCATVTNCDTTHRVNTTKLRAFDRALGARPLA